MGISISHRWGGIKVKKVPNSRIKFNRNSLTGISGEDNTRKER
jgi:hypothetical protein